MVSLAEVTLVKYLGNGSTSTVMEGDYKGTRVAVRISSLTYTSVEHLMVGVNIQRQLAASAIGRHIPQIYGVETVEASGAYLPVYKEEYEEGAYDWDPDRHISQPTQPYPSWTGVDYKDEQRSSPAAPALVVIMELIPTTSDTYMSSLEKDQKPEAAQVMVTQLAAILQYLHDTYGFHHRDLVLSNLLVKSTEEKSFGYPISGAERSSHCRFMCCPNRL